MMKKWITKNNCWTKEGEQATHTFMYGGKMTIPQEKMESFLQMYCECIRAGDKLPIVEQRTKPTFYFFLDVDFVTDHEMPSDVFDDLCRFSRAVISDRDSIVVCVTEPKMKDDKLKTGVHIHWNKVVHEKDVEGYINKIVDYMNNNHPSYDWNKFIDTSVYNGGGQQDG